MRDGLTRLAGSSLDRGEISAFLGSYEVSKQSAKPKMKYFRWNADMFENLINCLFSYKHFMKYRSLDFDAETSTMQVLKDWNG